ncbi:MAG: hypothetical protein KAR06_01215 [Deltaproteobacteria bacterium]|nr:hypothetical protein [Deltaproteobacteria bacterium]
MEHKEPGKTAAEAALNDDLLKAYRNTFCSSEGQEVLNHMLYELGFFNDEIVTEDQVVRRNYATTLIRRLGMGDNDAMESMVRGLIKHSVSVARAQDKGGQ